MGKQSEKKKREAGSKSGDPSTRQNKVADNSPKKYDKDTEVFISMAQELKEEGNKFFQKRDYEGAMVKYEKALKLLPKNHIDVSCIRSNIATTYMQIGLSEYPRAIHECNLALEVTPKYSKALLKRARCYEGLNRLDLALRDVSAVLKMEPQNVMALEIAERLRTAIESRGLKVNDTVIELPPDYVEPSTASSSKKVEKEKAKKKKKGGKVPKDVAEERANNVKVKEENSEDKVEVKNAEEIVEVKNAKEIVEVKEDRSKVEVKNAEGIVEKKDDRSKAEVKNAEGIVEKEDDRSKAEVRKAEEIVEKKDDRSKVVVKKAEEKDEGSKFEDEKVKEAFDDKKDEVKMVVEEKISTLKEDGPKKSVKLVFGEDIRIAQLPVNCGLTQLREVIRDRFPNLKAVLVKYRDQEGDLVTITTNEELRWAETSAESQGLFRLYIVEVDPEHDPFFRRLNDEKKACKMPMELYSASENGYAVENRPICIEDWIIEFAQLFKNHVGFESDAYLNLHELGMKVYSETLEETITSEEAQEFFDVAAGKFQELAALALFNWGNVHMSRARKSVYFSEDASREDILAQIRAAYDWAQKEYTMAGIRYEEAVKIKADFYEGVLALGLQQFERAKLSWYYAFSNEIDLKTWPSTEVLQLYNNAEENVEKGIHLLEESEKQHQKELLGSKKVKTQLQKTGLEGLFNDISNDEAVEQAVKVRSQINVLWGTMLYERSLMEFKLGLPMWHESLEVAVEKFGLAGVSETDITVMVKNHWSSGTAIEGFGFRIDEIVEAWNELYEAKWCQHGIPSLRLEPLLRRRVSKLYHALDHA